jgi:vacuolar-type H+-ATPase subunit E/Vma4
MGTSDESAERLREEILEQAQEECQEITKRARGAAERIVAAAAEEAREVHERRVEKGRAEALRRKELIESTVPVEVGRIRVGRIESLLESVRREVRKRLLSREGFDYREALTVLASLAISHMTGDQFLAKVAEADRVSFGNGLAEEITKRVDRPGLNVTLTFDPAMNGGGISVEDADASQVWDNGLVGRLDRMWPELRQQIALGASFIQKRQSVEEGQ